MIATTKILAKRVEELTEALAEVRENAKVVTEARKLAVATAYADEIVECIDGVIGPAEDDGDSADEKDELGEELDEELDG